jgi:type IV pilus assembly protein PilP
MMWKVLVLPVLSLVPPQAAEKLQPQPAPAAQAEQANTAAAPYAYNPEGRRDPFVSLLGRGNDPRQPTMKLPGVPGLLIAEVTVKGIVRDRAGFLAMVQAPDNKTFIVRPGDKLLDGVVKTITQDGVIFSQDVSDPLSLVKQREVSKRVRPTDGRV